MASTREREAMLRAIELSRLGVGRTFPNPTVGCVILDSLGDIVGEGVTSPAGGPHAEVVALAAAGAHASGGTAVVTLEPCAHTGRTGPCTDALAHAGISRVVFAVSDPDVVAAGGASVLADRGIEVEAALLADEAEAVNAAWLTSTRFGRPFVTVKIAASLDGRVAAADGSSQWITSDEARNDVHRLRAEVDAIAVGTGTVLADDPSLTVRHGHAHADVRPPLRVVIGNRSIPSAAQVSNSDAATLHLTTQDLGFVLAQLQDRQIRHVLVEGGPTLVSAFLRHGVVDRVVGYVAPVLLGAGLNAVGDLGVGTIGDAVRLTDVRVETLGSNVRFEGRPVMGQKASD